MGPLSGGDPVVQDVLANLSCLSTTSVASDKDNAAVVDALQYLTSACCNWKSVSLLLLSHQLRAGLASLTQIVGEVGTDIVHGGSGQGSLVNVAALPGVPVGCWRRPGHNSRR